MKMRSEVETNRSLIDSKTGYIEELKKQKAERPSIKDQEKAVEKLSKDIEEGNKKFLTRKTRFSRFSNGTAVSRILRCTWQWSR